MRKLILASTILFVVVGQTMAASTIWMELEVGGSNNGATCDNRQYFTPGHTEDGAVNLGYDGRLTWAVRLHASGTHLNESSQELEIRGVANFVFDLELYEGSVAPENLVTTATFLSTANTGNCGIEADPSKNPTANFLSNAAFAYSYNLNNSGPARIFDWFLADAYGHKPGGPRMDVHCYPKAAAGKLLGMGAGYSSWNKDPNYTSYTTGGLGKGDAPSYPKPTIPGCVGDAALGCFGWGPVAEGQIEGLVAGTTYVLRLVPGGREDVQPPIRPNNILRNEAVGTREVFAKAADTTLGDTITFVPQTPPPQFHIIGWSSVRNCGGVRLPIALDPAPAAGEPGVKTETRRYGVQTIVVDFDGDVTGYYSPGHISLTNGLELVPPPGIGEQLINGGHSLEINVVGSYDSLCYTIDITGAISNLATTPPQDQDCVVQVLAGDVNGDGAVTISDSNLVRSRNGQPITGNERLDVNCDGQITISDTNLVRSLNGHEASCW